MVIAHGCAPICHRAFRVFLWDLIELFQSAHVPKVVRQSERPVEFRSDGRSTRNIHVNPSKSLFRFDAGCWF